MACYKMKEQNIRYTLILLILAGLVVFLAREEQGSQGWDYEDTMAAVDAFVDSGVIADANNIDGDLLQQRILILSKEVNQYSSKRITAQLLLLNSQDSSAPIDLYINTMGGWLDDAFAIVDIIKHIEAPVNTIGYGGVSSAGAIILAAGTGARSAMPNTIVMVHANVEAGEGSFDGSTLDFQRFRQFWSQNSKVPMSWIDTIEDEEYYLSAQEALNYQIIDAILPPRGALHQPAE